MNNWLYGFRLLDGRVNSYQISLPMKIKFPNNPLLWIFVFYIVWIALLLLSGCNPVKQVLKDKAKLDKVAEVVIRSGYCANDTVIVSKSDTLFSFDTITNTELETYVKNDTVFKTMYKYRNITKTMKIRDTIQKIVLDNAQINQLKKDNDNLSLTLKSTQEQSKERLHWVIMLILVMSGYLLLKYYRK